MTVELNILKEYNKRVKRQIKNSNYLMDKINMLNKAEKLGKEVIQHQKELISLQNSVITDLNTVKDTLSEEVKDLRATAKYIIKNIEDKKFISLQDEERLELEKQLLKVDVASANLKEAKTEVSEEEETKLDNENKEVIETTDSLGKKEFRVVREI